MEYVTLSVSCCGLWYGVSDRYSHEFEGWALEQFTVYKGGLSIFSRRSPLPLLKYS